MKYVVPPLLVVVVLGLIGTISLLAGESFLAPSLGAAAFSQMIHPLEKSARAYGIFIGQVIGATAGFVGVLVAGQVHAAAVTSTIGPPEGRVVAMCVAAGLAAVVQIASGAMTPVGGATALVVALGLEKASAAGALRLFVGIGLVTALGEVGRRLVLAARAEPTTR